MLIDWNEFNIIAIIVGGLLYMVYGGIYYSVRLGGDKHPEKKQNEVEGPMKYVISVVVAFISSFIMAVFVQATGSKGIGAGMLIGFMVGLIITLVYLKNRLFGLMTKQSFMIAVGDHLIIFTLLGALHGWLM
ncbi:DUF1761 domain-containing protein [Paenisporosarcina sp. OV554]|uniref:DUF1761 domain-containing protein n=1 Tax=Paenisporosarcina sp. OV554 TaxID=2135694 RepID=UPI000D354448|nr:DUF1761 domain-containing protein [Paenisporosarcina sp. OV554]PUB11397.1 uncharacterized protein DUF1761 [Paenisporosarcina sp. OV554]